MIYRQEMLAIHNHVPYFVRSFRRGYGWSCWKEEKNKGEVHPNPCVRAWLIMFSNLISLRELLYRSPKLLLHLRLVTIYTWSLLKCKYYWEEKSNSISNSLIRIDNFVSSTSKILIYLTRCVIACSSSKPRCACTCTVGRTGTIVHTVAVCSTV